MNYQYIAVCPKCETVYNLGYQGYLSYKCGCIELWISWPLDGKEVDTVGPFKPKATDCKVLRFPCLQY